MSPQVPESGRWLALATRIDRLNEWVGRIAMWLVLAMVLLGAFNALARYMGRFLGVNLSSNLYIELQWYLFSLVFLFGAAYALRRNAHVRVDVVYSRLSERARSWIDLLGTLLLLIPFGVLLIWTAWPAVRNSWSVLEGSPDPGGLPRYPLKTMIPLAAGLVVLQGIAEVIRRVAHLRGLRASPEAEPGPRTGGPA